ncbi:winged helix-turn-helix transcriptional regulator [Spirosoma arcticum]
MASVETVGGKWKPFILTHLKDHTLRFGELMRLMPAVSQKVLTQQLKELADDGIVKRKVYAEVPPRVEYSLTPYGQTLRPVLEAMSAWGLIHVQRSQSATV